MEYAVRRGCRPFGIGPDLSCQQPCAAEAAGTASAVGAGGYACALQRHKDGFTGGSIHRDGAAVRYDRQRVALSRRSRIGRGMYLTGNLLMIALRRNPAGSQTIMQAAVHCLRSAQIIGCFGSVGAA